jgi:cell pole-organizing protein PopZ
MAQPTASVIAMPPPRVEPRAAERSFAPAAAVNAPAMNGHAHRPPNAPVPGAQQPESAHATTAEPVGSEAQAFAGVGLLSPQANAAVAASFESLAHEIAAKGMRDLDHTVESMLRPMLRDWLEANLPGMVERMVREEIERVSRGKR